MIADLTRKYPGRSDVIGIVLAHAFVLTAIIVNCHVHGLGGCSGIVFFCFIIFGILIPGIALLKLFKIDKIDLVQYMGYSYGLGIAVVLFEYFVTMPIGISWISPILAVVILAISLIYLVKNKSKNDETITYQEFNIGAIGCAVFILGILIMEYYTVSLVYTRPSEQVAGNAYHSDFLFWVGNNISAAKGFPMMDYRSVGSVLNYHYFSSLLIAQINLVTGIDIVDISFFFSNSLACLVIVFCAYTFFKSVVRSDLLVMLGCFFYILSYGTSVSTQWHMYYCPFGFDYGMSIGLLCISTVFWLYKHGKAINIQGILFSDILFGVCIGMKGPVGLIVLGGFGLLAVFWLKDHFKRAVVCGVNWIFIFVGVYLTFINGNYTKTTDEGAALQFFGLKNAISSNWWVKQVYDTITDGPLKNIRCFIAYYYNVGKVAFVLLMIGIVCSIVFAVKKCYSFQVTVCLVMSVVSLYLGVAFVQPGGGSQTYFLMMSIPYSICSGICVLDHILQLNMRPLGKYRRESIIVGFSVILLGIVFLFQSYHYYFVFSTRAKSGILANSGAQSFWDSTGKYMTYQQYLAYLWVRDNTRDDSIIVLDNFGTQEEYNSQIKVAGVFSERYVYNEYSVFVKQECERRKKIIQNIDRLDDIASDVLHAANVKYYLQNKAYSTDNLDESENVELVYDNEAFHVYRIK